MTKNACCLKALIHSSAPTHKNQAVIHHYVYWRDSASQWRKQLIGSIRGGVERERDSEIGVEACERQTQGGVASVRVPQLSPSLAYLPAHQIHTCTGHTSYSADRAQSVRDTS